MPVPVVIESRRGALNFRDCREMQPRFAVGNVRASEKFISGRLCQTFANTLGALSYFHALDTSRISGRGGEESLHRRSRARITARLCVPYVGRIWSHLPRSLFAFGTGDRPIVITTSWSFHGGQRQCTYTCTISLYAMLRVRQTARSALRSTNRAAINCFKY